MACMEFCCKACGDVWFGNDLRPYCKCGSKDTQEWFDEKLDQRNGPEEDHD
jgi:hypothetical protein